MHTGVPVCVRGVRQKKLYMGSPCTHNKVVRMWGVTYIVVKMLCIVVCRRGDIKRLEDPILNASSVCGRRVSMEEEVNIMTLQHPQR